MQQGLGNHSPGYPLPSRSRPPRRAEPKKSGVWPVAQRGSSTWEGLEPSPTGPPGNTNTTPCWVSPPKGAPMATSARHTTQPVSRPRSKSANLYHQNPGPRTLFFLAVISNIPISSKPQDLHILGRHWGSGHLGHSLSKSLLTLDASSALGTYHCSHLGPGPPGGSRSFQIGQTRPGQ